MLTVRLTPTEAAALNGLVKLRKYKSRAEAVRAALALLFDSHQIKAEAKDRIREERYKVKARRSNLAERL